jgi:hypothetical protein
MDAEHQLHAAERQVLLSARRFASYVRASKFVRADGVISGIACSFAALGIARELKNPAVVNEFQAALDQIDTIWNAVEHGTADVALQAYTDFLLWLPEAHERVSQMVVKDPGSRGGSTESFQEAAMRAASALGTGL